MRRALDGLYTLSGILGALALAATCAVMLAQAAFRGVSMMFRGADDITAWLCAASAFLPLAYTFRRGEIIRVTLVIDRLQGRARYVFELSALLLGAVATAYLAYWLAGMAYDSWQFDDRGQGLLPIPIWIPQAPLVFGAVVLWVAVVDDLVAILSGRAPSYRLRDEQRTAEELAHEV